LEALALAGGIAERGKAKKVKLIRGNLDNPKVYLIDLSTIDGIHHGNIIMQANDIIYVEPIGVTLRQVLSEVSPILGFVTSIITLYVVLERF
jgi:polysaccharide export outer membrane protein